MRLILAGPPAARTRMRARINGAPIHIVGEFSTIDAARRSGVPSDGLLVVEPTGHEEPGPQSRESLTARETEALELLADGLSNKAIADRLAISDQTVKFHVASVIAKLGAANRTGAVRRAVREGFLKL